MEPRNLQSHSEQLITNTVVPSKFIKTIQIKLIFPGAYQRYSEEQTLKIVLIDINDQMPIIETTSITISEEMKQGEIIATAIIATDKDDPNTDNAKIQFEIIGLEDSDGNEVEQLFEIASQQLEGIAYLSTIKDLEKDYGEYNLIIQVKWNFFFGIFLYQSIFSRQMILELIQKLVITITIPTQYK